MENINPQNAQDDEPSEVTTLRNLALRLLRLNPHLIETEQIFVRALPPDLPATLPWPDRIQLHGSYLCRERRTDETGMQFIRILFDCPLSPKDILDVYHQRLIATGWEEADRRVGGFIHHVPPSDRRSFSLSQQRLHLEVLTHLTDDNATAVSLKLTQILQPEGYLQPEYYPVVPDLKYPSTVYGSGPSGGGQGSDHASAETIVESDIGEVDLIALLRDYGIQLKQSGWTLVEEIHLGQLVESKWRLQSKDEAQWQGTLTIARIPGTRARYDVRVEADRLKASSGTIHVLIVDSQAVTRRNFTMIFGFESDLEVVGFASSSEEAIQQAARSQPDVILTSFPLPDMDRLDDLDQLSSRVPDTPIVVLIHEDAASLPWASLSTAVRAVLVKPPNVGALFEAIRYASQHDKHFPQRLYDQRRVSAIAQALDVTLDAINTAIDALEQRGFAVLYTDTDNHKCLVLTQKSKSSVVRLPDSETSLSTLEYNILNHIGSLLFDQTGETP